MELPGRNRNLWERKYRLMDRKMGWGGGLFLKKGVGYSFNSSFGARI
jgi:hypothetical protein